MSRFTTIESESDSESPTESSDSSSDVSFSELLHSLWVGETLSKSTDEAALT